MTYLAWSMHAKQMLLPNFSYDVIYTGNLKNSNKNNILMMFKQVLFDDFESMLLQKLNRINNGPNKKIKGNKNITDVSKLLASKARTLYHLPLKGAAMDGGTKRRKYEEM